MSSVWAITGAGLLICALLLPLPARGEMTECFGPDQEKAEVMAKAMARVFPCGAQR